MDFQDWAKEHGLHPGERVLEALDSRLDRRLLGSGPYFFCDLNETSEADEQAAIDAETISATGLHYVAATVGRP